MMKNSVEACIILFASLYICILSPGVSAKLYDCYFLSLKIGQAAPDVNTPFYDFWHNGLSISSGIRMPYICRLNYTQFWLNLDYSYYKFDRGSEFPIRYYYENPITNFDGDDIYTAHIYLKFKLLFLNPDKVIVPYLSYNYGYYHKSRTVLRSDSDLFERSKIPSTGGQAHSITLGTDVKINSHLKILVEVFYLSAYTEPFQTYLIGWSTGVLIR